MESLSPENDALGHEKKRKKRNLGSFPCPDCDKVFSRTDHLARHHLNHKPKELFECEFVMDVIGGGKKKCGKTFVRRDLRDRHLKRHTMNHQPRVNWSSVSSVSSHDSFISKDSPSKPIGSVPSTEYVNGNGHSNGSGPINGDSPLQISNLIHAAESTDRTSFTRPSPNINNNGGSNGQFVKSETNDKKNGSRGDGLTPNQVQINMQGQSPTINGFHQKSSRSHTTTTNQSPAQFTPTMYSKPDMFQNYNVMQSQNDILSWLFNDISPHNNGGISPLNESTLRPELTFAGVNLQISAQSPPGQNNPQSELLSVSESNNNNNHNNRTDQNDNEQGISTGVGITGGPGPAFDGTTSLSSLNPMSLNNLRSYDLADSNVFQNSSNPLDEVILRNYNQVLQQQLYHTDGQPTDGPEGNNPPTSMNERNNDHKTTPYNFSLPSSVSLTSPTNTNDSNPTPKLVNDIFSPSNSNVQNRLHEYGSKYNVATNKHIYIDKTILNQLFVALPTLQRSFVELIFNDKVLIEDRFSYYLSVYWLIFHPQFNILHKTSFKTSESEPLLLLSMILIGCNYSTLPDNPEHLSQPRSKSSEYKLALAIATPLRYAIFQHDAFKSPVRLWVLQGLNLLEWSEKNFLLRTMHERAHVHHGTTVQLMRRSPVLGGNPAAATNKNVTTSGGSSDDDDDDEENDVNNTSTNPSAIKNGTNVNKDDTELFRKWVESESMRRITFMTFYVDIADYVKFRHNPVISFHQLQLLKLPCDDDLWEATDVNGSFYKILKKQKKLAINDSDCKATVDPNENFLNIVKRLLKPNGKKNHSNFGKLKITPFVKKILFGGLLSIMYQMQQFELQNSLSLLSLQTNANFQTWKQVISVAIDNFGLSIGESCKRVLLNKDSKRFIDGGISTCKFPIYHIAQIVALPDLNTYDISIFCGSPANQNVNISLKDRNVVERKLLNIWIRNLNDKVTNSDIINLKGIIHCFIFLWETLLDSETGDQPHQIWNPNKDYFDGMFAMSLVMQTLWSYIYLSSGVESIRFNEIKENIYQLDYEKLADLSAETGYEYLLRIRQEFLTYLRKDNLHRSFSIDKLYKLDNDYTPHDVVVKYCSILSNITNKQNISGLCFLIGSKLYNSQWEPVRENGKLIINCGLRSIGKTEVLCSDVFDVELLD